MQQKQLLHTPEGVRDLYHESCARKLTVQEAVLRQQRLYGYRSIQTPTFEFFDIFSQERGSVSSREMYKFFDREGNTLVLRPDMTPSVARCAAKYFMDEEMPLRFCYCGNTFINNSSYQGRLKEVTQMGAELVGDETSDADGEMIAMLISCLKSAGLEEFQVEIGHIDFFNGLMEEAELASDEIENLRELIENKNYFGVEELLLSKDLKEDLKEAIMKIPQLFGSLDQIQEARNMTSNPRALQAIDRLEKLYDILELYGLERYVSFDLGMLGKFRYYTGIIFKAMTYGTGEPIATGGRYDRLMEQFGKKAASVGCAIVVDSLLMALDRQKINLDTDLDCQILLYDRSRRKEAVRLAGELRLEGLQIQLMKEYREKRLEDYVQLARRSSVSRVLYLEAGKDSLQQVEIATGRRSCLEPGEYLRLIREGGR